MPVTRFWKTALVLMGFMLAGASHAKDESQVLRLQKINSHVYAVVGPLGNRTPENLGNNSTSGFVITPDGVVLIDSGGSYQGAAAIQALIGQVTKQPVKVVINTGGQDHRWLGNGFFKERGARIVASRKAVADQRERYEEQYFMLANLVGNKGMQGTAPIYAEETFDETHRITLGGIVFELRQVGPAHTPSDSLVWLPEEQVVFAGDVVFVERLLGVLPHSNSRGWIKAFEAMADMKPKVVVPGHGRATDLAQARKDTYDYLVFLRKSVADFIDSGGAITRIGKLDQARFAYLDGYEILKGRNAQQVFQEMEWE